MIRDKIAFSVSSKLPELLLHESNCRTCEITSRAKKETSPPREEYPIDKIEAQHQRKQNNAVKTQQKDGPVSCGNANFAANHMKQQRHNAVWGKTCNYCKGRRHFEVKCKKVNLLNVGRD